MQVCGLGAASTRLAGAVASGVPTGNGPKPLSPTVKTAPAANPAEATLLKCFITLPIVSFMFRFDGNATPRSCQLPEMPIHQELFGGQFKWI